MQCPKCGCSTVKATNRPVFVEIHDEEDFDKSETNDDCSEYKCAGCGTKFYM